ncbi:MAG: ABC transporter permease [Chloroflexota bacterium]|nr:ABC transporter permease [Chloroflexota bacterium]
MFLARSNLLHDKVRLALSVIGVALAMMLILLLFGLRSGVYAQISGYVNHTPGSVVVLQQDDDNILSATSVLPPGSADAARAVPGVAQVTPILLFVNILDLHEKKVFVYLVGYDPAIGGGPWKLAQGRAPQTDHEIVFDRVLAEQHGIHVGDTLPLLGQPFTVVGLSDGTTSWMSSFLFMRKSAAESLLRMPGATSFLLVTPDRETTPTVLRDRLRSVPGTDSFLKQSVVTNDQKLFGSFLDYPLQIMAVVAFLVGTLVVGLVIYTATAERHREYGVLKAVGARNGTLYRTVALQAVLTTGAGVVVGLALASGGARLIMTLRPQFLVTIGIGSIATTILAAALMALVAALFPVRVLASLAPADVFRR